MWQGIAIEESQKLDFRELFTVAGRMSGGGSNGELNSITRREWVFLYVTDDSTTTLDVHHQEADWNDSRTDSGEKYNSMAM